MQSLEELEAELQHYELIAGHSSRSPVPLAPLETVEINTLVDLNYGENVVQPGASQLRPKTMDDLLRLLENAPAGPVELDASLLYSPRSSCSQSTDGRVSPRKQRLATPAAPLLPFSSFRTNAPSERSVKLQRTAQRPAQIREDAQRHEMKECTFAPQTGRAPIAGSRSYSHLPVEERLLLNAGHRRMEAARRLQKEREEVEQAQCTFAPHLASSPSKHMSQPHRPPIHQRLGEEWRRKEATMEQARAKANADATFQPRLNSISLRMAAERRQREESQGSSGLVVVPRVRKGVPAAAEHDMTFQPAINPVSARMLQISSSVPENFHRRQRHFDRVREEHRAALCADAENENCTFAPSCTGGATAILALSDKRFEQLLEAPEQRWERMAVGEADERAARHAVAQQHAVAREGPFSPNLNPRSLRLAQGMRRGVADPEALEDRDRRAEHRRVESSARELRECTFFPNTSKPRVVGYYDEYQAPQPTASLSVALAAASDEGLDGLSQRIQQRHAQKERWAAEMRAREENREMKECTFAPDTTKAPVVVPQGNVPVPGLGRFLEIKAMAERQQAELQARAAKVFLQHPRSPSRRGPTVVKPFKLASEERGAKRALQGK